MSKNTPEEERGKSKSNKRNFKKFRGIVKTKYTVWTDVFCNLAFPKKQRKNKSIELQSMVEPQTGGSEGYNLVLEGDVYNATFV